MVRGNKEKGKQRCLKLCTGFHAGNASVKMRCKTEDAWCGEGEVGRWFHVYPTEKLKGQQEKSVHNKLKTN